MFCKKCNKITVCKAVDPKQVRANVSTGRRLYRTSHEDIHYFRRGRICLTCNSSFLTAELQEKFLTELTELREALGQIKVNAESYLAQSEAASESLNQLSESLEVLRALKIYKSQSKEA